MLQLFKRELKDELESSLLLQVQWRYEILWGREFRRRHNSSENSAVTSDTSYVVRNLHACQTYLLAVMLSSPLGYGPAVQVQVMTGNFRPLLRYKF